MNRKHLFWLLVVTAAVAVLLLLYPARTAKENRAELDPLFPDLAAEIHDLDRVTVVGAGGDSIATLVRQTEGWAIEEAGGYAADRDKLRELLVALAQANIVEPKTANPEYFPRLGVQDIEAPDSAGLLIRLHQGERVRGLLIGATATERNGQYVRMEGGEGALLIDQALNVPRERRDWMDREVIDIAPAEVVEVQIAHSDGDTLEVRKVSADDEDFVLQGVPPGRQPQSGWSINALGGVLADIRLEEAVRADTIDWTDATRLRVLTADGLLAEAELVRAEEKTWIRIDASAYPAAVRAGDDVPPPESAGADAAPDAEITGDQTSPAVESGPAAATVATALPAPVGEDADDDGAAARAAAIDQRVAGWAYVVPGYKATVMTRRQEDLLQPLEQE